MSKKTPTPEASSSKLTPAQVEPTSRNDMESPSVISSASFDEYNTQLQTSILKATRHAAALPGDIKFYTSMDKNLAREVDACSSRVLAMTNKMLDLAATAEVGKGKKRARLEGEEDVMDRFRTIVVDALERVIEGVDMSLDGLRGLFNPPPAVATLNPPQPTKPNKPRPSHGRLDPALQHAAHLAKPQLQFKRQVDNSNYSTWQPALKHKYNAQVPLGYRMSAIDNDELAILGSHPYQHEVKHIRYPPHMFRFAEPIPFKGFEETPFVWVDTPELFASLLDHLRNAREIAVDLEHHDYRSFFGFVCLMQISTRECDFVVDTLALREELEELNEVFTDPKIVKVFHGAESDILWLQRDFNLYIVNLFDTFHASRALDFPRHSLSTLLEMYCDFTPDKRYQLADWRIRPLPQEMLDYARSDTHYLLFIYDNLRNALLDRSRSQTPLPTPTSAFASTSTSIPTFTPSSSHLVSPTDSPNSASLLRDVLSRSEETALRVFEKEAYDTDMGSGAAGWDLLARKWNKGYLTSGGGGAEGLKALVRLEVYKTVHAWRDRIARAEDESTRYILPNHYIFSIAEQPPADMAALHHIFPSVPPLIRTRGKDLLDAIRGCVKRVHAAAAAASATTAAANKVLAGAVDVDVDEVMAEAGEEVGEVMMMESEEKMLGVVSSVDVVDVRAAEKQSPDLFASKTQVGIQAELPSTQMSSLFGSSANMDRRNVLSVNNFLTRKSSLFNFEYAPSVSLSNRNKFAFRDILFRIHNDLTISPSIPKLPNSTLAQALSGPSGATTTATIHTTFSSSSATTTTTANSKTNNIPKVESIPADGLSGQIEIPFVPREKRRKRTNSNGNNNSDDGDDPNDGEDGKKEEDDQADKIVVVGRQRTKKRKRVAAGATSGAEVSISAPSAPASTSGKKKKQKSKAELDEGGEAAAEAEAGEIVPFDFNAENGESTNILDQEGDHHHEVEDRNGKKKKKGKVASSSSGVVGFNLDLSGFKAPPKAHSHLQKGNISRTFKA